MKRIVFIFVILFFSCKRESLKIVHIEQLTDIDSSVVNDHLIINRTDNFILYDFKGSKDDSAKIRKTIQVYADSFSGKFSNYIILVYKSSEYADTNYIKKFERNYAYKAIIDEKPLLEFHWWTGKFTGKPTWFD